MSPNHFRTPTALPIVGALACAFLVTPLALQAKKTYVRDPSDLAGGGPS